MEARFGFESVEEMEKWKKSIMIAATCAMSELLIDGMCQEGCNGCSDRTRKALDTVCHVLPESPLQISERLKPQHKDIQFYGGD